MGNNNAVSAIADPGYHVDGGTKIIFFGK